MRGHIEGHVSRPGGAYRHPKRRGARRRDSKTMRLHTYIIRGVLEKDTRLRRACDVLALCAHKLIHFGFHVQGQRLHPMISRDFPNRAVRIFV